VMRYKSFQLSMTNAAGVNRSSTKELFYVWKSIELSILL
jgi:hypothetical protein